MASVEELYQRACDDVTRMQTPELDSELRRIWILIGVLSDAFWRTLNQRTGEPGFKPFEYLIDHYEGECRAETAEEIAIWNELTSPQNYRGLLGYAEYLKRLPANDYATRLLAALLQIAVRR